MSRKEDRESERLHTDTVLDIAEEQRRIKDTVGLALAFLLPLSFFCPCLFFLMFYF
jgi:hypothetical protein